MVKQQRKITSCFSLANTGSDLQMVMDLFLELHSAVGLHRFVILNRHSSTAADMHISCETDALERENNLHTLNISSSPKCLLLPVNEQHCDFHVNHHRDYFRQCPDLLLKAFPKMSSSVDRFKCVSDVDVQSADTFVPQIGLKGSLFTCGKSEFSQNAHKLTTEVLTWQYLIHNFWCIELLATTQCNHDRTDSLQFILWSNWYRSF